MVQIIVASIILISASSCSNFMRVTGSARIKSDPIESTFRVINPIIEFCERSFPEILYPDEFERETNIVDCMKLCSETGSCTIDPGLLQ